MTRLTSPSIRAGRLSVQLASVIAVAVLLLKVPLDAQVGTPTPRLFRPSTATGDVVYRPTPLVDRLCRLVVGLRGPAFCPTPLSGRVPAKHFLPPLDIAADLPHLRMDLVIKRLENQVVGGGGLNLELDVLQTSINSMAATSQYYDQAPWFGTVSVAGLPDPGEVIGDFEAAYGYEAWMYGGIIANGCSPATVFDVHLSAGVFELPSELGHVDLADSVTGNGYYTFKFTVRATDGRRTSDFVFSGPANVYCTGQASF